MLSLAELLPKKASSIDKVEAFRLQQQALLERGQRWFLLPALLLVVGGGLLVGGKLGLGFLFMGISLVAFLLVGAFKIIPAYTRYNDQFKRTVLYALLEDLYPSVYYAPDNYVPSSILTKAQLYSVGELYKGKDYVEGETGRGNTFRFSKLSIKNNLNDAEEQQLFEGLFLVVDIAKYCEHPVCIVPVADALTTELAEGLDRQPLAHFLNSTQKANYTEKQPDFVHNFMIYSKESKLAQSFLNDTLLEALYQWYTQWRCAAHLSFIGQQLFIALSMPRVFPVPDLNQKAATNEDLDRFYEQLLYCLSVVEIFGEVDVCTQKSQDIGLDNADSAPLRDLGEKDAPDRDDHKLQ
jgi:hypothetical protein